MTEIDSLFESIRTRDQDQLKTLINKNPKLVNAKHSQGFTPLIFASYFDNFDASKFLIANKSEIDAKDNTGNTALIGVCFKGNEKLATLLIDKGSDINAKNNMGTTPLIFATMYNKEYIIKLLLNRDADKTIKDNQGKTAYTHALEKGFNNLLKLLKQRLKKLIQSKWFFNCLILIFNAAKSRVVNGLSQLKIAYKKQSATLTPRTPD